MKLRFPDRRRLLRRIAFLIVLVLFGLYILLPVSLGIVAVFPAKQAVGEPPPGFESVTLRTADGAGLAGWWAPPSNGAAILLLHGAGNSREAVRPYAELLRRHGYGVLALDMQGHGESAGRTNRYGWQSGADVRAAVDFLQGRPEVGRIGSLGLSLGGETLLGAAGDVRALDAIVADGATVRSLAELVALPSERPLVRNFVPRVQFATVQLLSRQAPPRPLLESMRAAPGTRYLLIAGGNVSREIAYNTYYAETVGERVLLWVAPEAEHTGAFGRHPEEYEQRVIAFFDAMLLGEPAGSR